MKKLAVLKLAFPVLAALLLALAIACSGEPEVVGRSAAVDNATVSEAVVTPTAIPTPTLIPVPTAEPTAQPSATPEAPTVTLSPMPPPTPTMTVGPTATPEPTATPLPTATPTPTPNPTSTPTATASPSVTATPGPTPKPTPTTPRYTLTTRDDDPYYKQFIEVAGVTVKAAAHVDPAALQAAARIIDVMLDGREDIAKCMANAGAGMLIIPKDDPLTSLPDYSHWKGKVDPNAGRSYDEIIRGSGGHPQPGHPDNAATDETHLLWTPPDPEVTAHEYAHSIQNFCFTPEDDAKWNALYDAARQADPFPKNFPGRYAMVNRHEFWAMLSNVYLGADRVLDPGNRAEVRALVETEVPGVWSFLEEIYGALTTPTPEPGSVYVHYGIEGGETFPWRTYVGGTYQDDELGFSIDIPPGWVEVTEHRRRPGFIAVFRYRHAGFRILARPLPSHGSLKSFAEGVRDGWLKWSDENSQMFEAESFEERSVGGRESWFMTFSRPASPGRCPDVVVMSVVPASQNDARPAVITLRGETCQNDRVQYVYRQDLLDMFASFRFEGRETPP